MQDDIITPKQPPAQDTAVSQVENGPDGQPLNNPLPAEEVEAAKAPQVTNDAQPEKKKKGHGLAIAFAVIVFVALSGLAVYVGIQQDKSEQVNQSSPLIDL